METNLIAASREIPATSELAEPLSDQVERADSFLGVGLVADAEEMFERILDLAASSDDGHYAQLARLGMARCARARGDLHEALARLQALRMDGFSAPRVENDWAVVCFDLGLLDEAAATLRGIVARDPDNLTGWQNLVEVCLAMQDHSGSQTACREVLRIDITDDRAQSVLRALDG